MKKSKSRSTMTTNEEDREIADALRQRDEYFKKRVAAGEMTMTIVDGQPVYKKNPPKEVFKMDTADGLVSVTLDEEVIKIGAELGSLTLFGASEDGKGWIFGLSRSDQTPVLVDEPSTEGKSMAVSSWNAAVELLDTYQWTHLHLVRVHPQFRELLWDEFKKRHEKDPVRERKLERWKDILKIP